MIALPSQFFVTGTDTSVGKTVVSALLTLGLQGAYWKPIQSGLDPIGDTDYVRKVTGLPDDHFFPERFKLTQPLSPHAAAAIDGVSISLDDFELPATAKPYLIVEGAGGILVPINNQYYILDLIQHLKLPVVLVARSTLGTINHTLLSLKCLRQARIPVVGVILNGPKNPGNAAAIETYGKVSILAEIELMETVEPAMLKQQAKFLRL
ncbi:MAG: dethiobiotin synthase [Cyanobacteria bacterium P01_H01_bin.121]